MLVNTETMTSVTSNMVNDATAIHIHNHKSSFYHYNIGGRGKILDSYNHNPYNTGKYENIVS